MIRRTGLIGGVSKGNGVVAVAVDGDRNSQYALKWAGDHLLTHGQIFYLLHIRRKITSVSTRDDYLPISNGDDEVASKFLEQCDLQTRELLLPFQCFCNRRGLQCKEIILDEIDVAKGIVDFVMHRSVDKLVVGASNHGAIAAFAKPDVSTAVCRAAPDFCSVYVIAKGSKIVSVRPASRPNKSSNWRNIRFSGEIESTAKTSFQSVKTNVPCNTNLIPFRLFFLTTSIFHLSFIRQSFDQSSKATSLYNDRIGDKIKCLDEDESVNSQESFMSCPSPSRASLDLTPTAEYISRDLINKNGRKLPSPLSSSGHREDSLYQDGPLRLVSKDPMVRDSNNGMAVLVPGMLKYHLRRLEQLFGDKLQITQFYFILCLAIQNSRRGVLLCFLSSQEFKKYSTESSVSDLTEEDEMVTTPLKQRKPAPEPETREKRKLIEGFVSEVSYRRYSMDEIDLATNYFSDQLKIGEGGYGPVYQATLNHTLVAIKALRSDISTTQGLKQFQQELEVLSSIKHPNMVNLLGACPEYGCLVYEYMSNGSLEDRLACQSGTPPLPWQLRFKIAFDIATGLLFLHQQCPEPLVHRDLKPGNILLDHNLVAKISDVGLARLIPLLPGCSNSTLYHMTAAAGTFCYIDPEYQKTGMLGTKSDVYALGIILLQLVTGRSPMGLTYSTMTALENGNLRDTLDPKVPDWPLDETKRLVELALKCSELRRKDRPDLGSVIWPELSRLAAFAESRHDS
ncbi:U-box domain-containing protein 35-like protein [Carex littledalei]|uniref:RING-type E3 ubiquitin transferase n=1 Tax=Carex littledalei TaxID=544730 RepID=A0A833QWE0_9POAL|nr:U-box domain-containing protein 35-like protein [Carex littledalei]